MRQTSTWSEGDSRQEASYHKVTLLVLNFLGSMEEGSLDQCRCNKSGDLLVSNNRDGLGPFLRLEQALDKFLS